MGLLRLLLAAAVVFAHTPLKTQFTGGRLAVEAFFVISGFYVALVLERSYRRPADFYINRYLRLAPIYLALASISLISWKYFDVAPLDVSSMSIDQLGLQAQAFLIFTNVTMVFQDLVMFTCHGPNGLHFVTSYNQCSPPLYAFLLIPQAWSLGVELMFYALAPWLLRLGDRALFNWLLASVTVRVVLHFLGLSSDPWDYRFFPSELWLFLAGSLAFRYRNRWKWLKEDLMPSVKLFGMLTFAVVYSRLPYGAALHYVFLLVLLISLPALLKFSSDHRWDRQLGELSYPLYLSHLIVIGWLHTQSFSLGPAVFSWLALVISLGVSYFLYRTVDIPMERFRARRRAVVTADLDKPLR